MKNMKTYYWVNTFLLVVFLLNTGCLKKKMCSNLPVGYYLAEITEDGVKQVPYQIDISEVTNDYIVIDGNSIKRDGCKVEGEVVNASGKHMYIKGQIKKKNKKYRIEGTFTSKSYSKPLGGPASSGHYNYSSGEFIFEQP